MTEPPAAATSSPDATAAHGSAQSAEVETPEEVEVAFGDDAEGAVGSGAPVESTGADTGGA